MFRCGWLLLLVSSATWAQTPRALFDEGTALYSRGQFAEAAVKFEASFAARPVPVTKFNIARAWEQAGETLKAIDAWQAWLVMSPTAAERPAAEASLKALGDKLARSLRRLARDLGGDEKSMDTVSYGVEKPLVEYPTRGTAREWNEAAAANNRVEIHFR
jgi:tetratricopeptide (TPR) repeat protein